MKWLNDIVKIGMITELTREIIVSIVDMIHITNGNQIKITFKYADEFNRLKNYVNKNEDVLGSTYVIK